MLLYFVNYIKWLSVQLTIVKSVSLILRTKEHTLNFPWRPIVSMSQPSNTSIAQICNNIEIHY